MIFGRPGFLWLLALAVPVAVLHFYRGRIRTLPVPTLLLWDRVLVVEERRTALQRLRHLASLLVALGSIAVLALALAEPEIPGLTPRARRFALVVDTSPEIEVRGPDGRPRREAAMAVARELLDRLGRKDTASIFDAAGLVAPATADAGTRRAALNRIPRGLPALDAEALHRLVRAADPEAELLVISARVWAGGVKVVRVGAPAANAGLVAMEARREKGRVAIDVEARNAADAPAARTIEIRVRGRKAAEAPAALGPRESRRFALEVPAQPGEMLLEARLVPADPVPEDDLAGFVLEGAGPVPVLVVSDAEPDPHLVSALQVLQAAGETVVGAANPRDVAAARVPGAVVIFDRCDPPAALEDGGFLIAGGGGAHAPARILGRADAPSVIGWDRASPLNRWTGYSGVHIRRSGILDGPGLLETDRGAVAAAGRGPGLAWIQFGFSFRVEESDFALTPAFPIFLREALRWLAGEGRRAFPSRIRSGAVLEASISLPPGEVLATDVDGEAGRTRSVPVEAGRARIPALRPGLLRLEYGGRVEWAAVTGGPPLDAGRLAEGPSPAGPERLAAWRDLPPAPVAAAAAGLLLLAEWLLLRRGTR